MIAEICRFSGFQQHTLHAAQADHSAPAHQPPTPQRQTSSPLRAPRRAREPRRRPRLPRRRRPRTVLDIQQVSVPAQPCTAHSRVRVSPVLKYTLCTLCTRHSQPPCITPAPNAPTLCTHERERERERERDASACMRRHQASALAPVLHASVHLPARHRSLLRVRALAG